MRNVIIGMLVFSFYALASNAAFEDEISNAVTAMPQDWFSVAKKSKCKVEGSVRYVLKLKCNEVVVRPSIEFDGDLYTLGFMVGNVQFVTDHSTDVKFEGVEADISLRHFSLKDIQIAASRLNI